MCRKYGLEISVGAEIGEGFYIGHPYNITVAEGVRIGRNVNLHKGCTIGRENRGKRQGVPTIGNNVLIGSGAKVLGPFRVGDNARIASGAVVLREVPPNCTAVGVPAHVARLGGKAVHYADDVDQINVKDPVLEKLAAVSSRLELVEKLLDEQYVKNNPQDHPAESEK